MSAISNFLSFLRSAIYAVDVRDGIADAIEQCYNDVNNPTLKTEALEAALQTKIDQGEMAALTIGDHTITAAKLAQGVIDNTLATSGAAADAKKTGDEIAAVKADLQDLEETVDAIEPGLSVAAKAALLACLREIPFLDSSTNYAALEAALFDGYPKITVSYNPGQNIIYTDYELDALKTYMTVKYYESSSDAGTTILPDNYTLSGTLIEGVNSILCQYGNYATSFAVIAVNRILYALENPVILDGSTYIDTGIDLLATNRSFTILIDAVDACNHYTDTKNKFTFNYAQNASPYYQLNIQTYNGGTGGVASGKYKVRSVVKVASPSGITKSVFDYIENTSAPDTTKHNRYVIRYNHTTGTFSFAMSRDGSKITPSIADDNGYTYVQINETLRISNATGGFTGTIYAFNVYNYACSDAETNNFLGGSN